MVCMDHLLISNIGKICLNVRQLDFAQDGLIGFQSRIPISQNNHHNKIMGICHIRAFCNNPNYFTSGIENSCLKFDFFLS